MSNVPPEGTGGDPGPWGSQPGSWGSQEGSWGGESRPSGQPGGGGQPGWGSGAAGGPGWGASTPPPQGQGGPYDQGQYGQGQYGQGQYGQGLPSYSQFGGQQGGFGPSSQGGNQLASWGQRAGGYIIDAVIIGVPTAVLYIIGAAANTPVLVVLGALWGLVMWIWFAVQSGQYGSSPGMRVMGLKLVRASTGQVIGGGMGFVRELLHVVAWALCGLVYILDMLWPLWDGQRQTLADKVVGTVVLRVPPEGFSLVPRSR